AAVQEGKYADAESHYREALAGRPTAEIHNGLGYVLARRDRTDEAVREFRKAIEVNPKFTPAYNNLAEALEKQGSLEEAGDAHQRSLAQRPPPAVHAALGGLLRRLGKTDQAAEQFRQANASESAR